MDHCTVGKPADGLIHSAQMAKISFMRESFQRAGPAIAGRYQGGQRQRALKGEWPATRIDLT
jgi:hypothetical protein